MLITELCQSVNPSGSKIEATKNRRLVIVAYCLCQHYHRYNKNSFFNKGRTVLKLQCCIFFVHTAQRKHHMPESRLPNAIATLCSKKNIKIK